MGHLCLFCYLERKVELADIEIVTRYVNDLRKLLNESEAAERKALINSFVKEIEVTNDTLVMKYTVPMAKEGLFEEELSVPHIVRYGGRYWIRTSDLCDVNATL